MTRGLILLVAASFSSRCYAAQSLSLSSPDEQVRIELTDVAGEMTFAVSFRGRPVIKRSPMVFGVDDVQLTEGAKVGGAGGYGNDESYPWRGVHSKAVNRCRGVIVELLHRDSGAKFKLELRAYNDGAAFRHIIPAAAGSSEPRVPTEATRFALPKGSRVWFHDLKGHYESEYESAAAEEVEEGQWIAPPLTFKLPEGGGYGSITEAALLNYSGMALKAVGKGGVQLVLGHEHPPSYPFRLRYEEDIERMSKQASVDGTITSPWRVVMVGADLNSLVNSDLVPNLCPPPDSKLFPEGVNTAWCKPGRAVWKYLDGGENSFEEMKNFSRWAGELGFEYHVIEGFWRRWSDEQISELVKYSRERGVGLWFWRHSRELRSPEAREEFFARLERLGVVGAKIDFFDHEHKAMIDLYTALLESAARHRILVNFHGANKPTGESRTWPNEMIREGVRGMEARRLQERAAHNATLPFARYLAGHGDYTPVVFGERRGDTTAAHQIATAAVFNEPLLTYGAHPRTLLEHPAVEMIKSIPAVWDETIAMPKCEIGELAAFARRHGKEWFLAVLNGPGERTIDAPLSFLGEGQYKSMLVGDEAGDPTAVKIENRRHERSHSIALNLAPGGGFIARFRPNSEQNR
jgi:alpha-glucosidase